MITKQQKKAITNLWFSFSNEANNISWTGYANRLFDETMSETKNHDRGRPADTRRGLSKLDEARYFALKRYAEFAAKEEPDAAPDPAMIFHFQRSVYLAYAIYADPSIAPHMQRFNEENKDAMRELLTFDYCEMIKD